MEKNCRKSPARIITLFIGMIVTSLCAPTWLRAQTVTWQLNQVKEKIAQIVAEKKPEWKHTSVTPMQGSENTIVDQWAFEGLVARVSVVEHNSESDATEALQRLISEGSGRVKPQPYGDEGYIWNERGSIAFRAGRLVLYISAVSTKVDDSAVLTDEGNEAKVTKELAKYAADALKDSK